MNAKLALFQFGAAALLAASTSAANFTTKVTQAAGQNWSAAIWAPDAGGAAAAPAAGNTYVVASNGVAIANLSVNARVRNPTSAGLQTFPGDSMTITTNAEFRFKTGTGLGSINFPGVGGNPGLIMDGGVWNIADAFNPSVTGRVQIASALLYDAVNDHNGALDAARGVRLDAILSGPGTFIAFNAHTNTPISINNSNNTFTGKWLITGGRLLGNAVKSLGTNDITIDPQAALGLEPSLEGALKRGPAILEVNYDLNSAGTLTLANGGMMKLHQNCAFAAVNIEGVALAAGTHLFSELTGTFPGTFPAGGSGAITVQPFGALPLLIIQQPLGQALYAGRTVKLSVSVSGVNLEYEWMRKSGENFSALQDGNGFSGVHTPTLTISNLDVNVAGQYAVRIFRSDAPVQTISDAAAVSVATPTGGAYETAVLAAGPYAYYQLNDTGDPASGTAAAADFVGGFNGVYGTAMQNGNPGYNIMGPLPTDSLPGFVATNAAALGTSQVIADSNNSRVNTPAWNLNTNAVTMTAWIYPVGQPQTRAGVIFTRGGDTIAGLYFAGTANTSGNYSLTYNWNDDGNTFNWNSGVEVTADKWNFVALSLTPTNATIYVLSEGSFKSAMRTNAHPVKSFNGPGMIGNDTLNTQGLRAFNGRIDDVAIFNRSLSQANILSLYSAASGVATFPPTITGQPVAQTVYAGQTLELNVTAGGSPAPTFQWQFRSAGGAFVNLTNSLNVSGANSSALRISGIADLNAGDYQVIISNSIQSVTSDIAAIVVLPVGPPEQITTSAFLAIGLDWNSPGVWSDGLTASESAVAKPGSDYEVLPGARLRSPDNAADSVFPGDVLKVSGDGVFLNNPAASSTIGEIRFKQGSPSGRVYFKRLIMDGGQLDATNPNIVILDGSIEIRTNTPIYNDTTADRGMDLVGVLSGSGNIEYRGYSPNTATFNPGFQFGLNIKGASNSFSGKWNVIIGVLMGSGDRSLGTNDITVGAQGALELNYDHRTTSGTLTLDGRMFLHQNVAFRSVIVGGTNLAVGTYSAAQLQAQFPNQFPASWSMQSGSTVSAASGSVQVLGDAGVELKLQHELLSAGLKLTWPAGQLQESLTMATNSWTTLSVTSPHTNSLEGPAKFFRIIQ